MFCFELNFNPFKSCAVTITISYRHDVYALTPCRKPSEMVPIPQNIREVLFRFSWDKILVDVRRTIVIAERGKQEVYTAMVAVGNQQVVCSLCKKMAEFSGMMVRVTELKHLIQHRGFSVLAWAMRLRLRMPWPRPTWIPTPTYSLSHFTAATRSSIELTTTSIGEEKSSAFSK